MTTATTSDVAESRSPQVQQRAPLVRERLCSQSSAVTDLKEVQVEVLALCRLTVALDTTKHPAAKDLHGYDPINTSLLRFERRTKLRAVGVDRASGCNDDWFVDFSISAGAVIRQLDGTSFGGLRQLHGTGLRQLDRASVRGVLRGRSQSAGSPR